MPALRTDRRGDTAAAQAIVEEAGGHLTDMQLRPRCATNARPVLINPDFFAFGDANRDWSQYLPSATRPDNRFPARPLAKPAFEFRHALRTLSPGSATEGFQHDPAQERAVQSLQNLRSIDGPAGAGPVSKNRVCSPLGRTRQSHRRAARRAGLYLGRVGRGKTYLVDTFVDAPPLEHKQRIHFHSFMQAVHAELKALKIQRDPLRAVARRSPNKRGDLPGREFFVADITDAMLLAACCGSCSTRASPLSPLPISRRTIYTRDGLQNGRFLPAIELLKQHLDILNVWTAGGLPAALPGKRPKSIIHRWTNGPNGS